MSERDEAGAIETVIDRLTTRFSTLSREHIADIVNQELRKQDGARVRDFIPVLVERAATERLRTEADPVSAATGDEDGSLAPAENLDPMEIEARSEHTGLLLGDSGGGKA